VAHAEEWAFAGCPAGTTCRLTFPAISKRDVANETMPGSVTYAGRWTFLSKEEVESEFAAELQIAKVALISHVAATSGQVIQHGDITTVEGKAQPAVRQLVVTLFGKVHTRKIDEDTSGKATPFPLWC